MKWKEKDKKTFVIFLFITWQNPLFTEITAASLVSTDFEHSETYFFHQISIKCTEFVAAKHKGSKV